MKNIITKPHPINPALTYYLIDKIYEEEIWIAFSSEGEYFNYLKLLEIIAFEIKNSVYELRKKGIKGNENNIKKIIYNKWEKNIMKNKKIISIIAIFFACIVLVSGYTANSYQDIQSTLRNDYTADNYDNIESIFGSDEITDTCTCSGTENCIIDCADNCNLSIINMNDYNVLANGTGNLYNIRNIKNATRIRIQGGCVGKW